MKTLKQILSLLLCLAMVLSFFPAAYAEGEGSIAPVEEDGEHADGAGTIAPADPSEDPDVPVGADAPGGPEEREDPSTRPDGHAQEHTEDGIEALPAGDEVQGLIASGTCGDNLTWTLEDGVLTISGTGPMKDWNYSSDPPWYDYRDTITDIFLPEGLTSIGHEAFSECECVASVEIPSSVTSIGYQAFYKCSSLTSLTIPERVTSLGRDAFTLCSSLTSVEIPESVTYIGDSAFNGCEKLTSVRIPPNMTSIMSGVFQGCSSLTSVTIPEGLTSIGGSAFSGCNALTSVIIPSTVTSIESQAFFGCSSLTSVTIPEGVTRIEDCTFERCSSLTRVELLSSLTSIGEQAFYDCSSLTTVTIPEGVTIIGHSAFSYCSSLTTISFLGDAPSFDTYVFSKVCSVAFYPADNETWTPEKKQHYGGNITWLSDRDIPALYTIEFDPNGGSDAPVHQIKIHGEDLILTNDRPFRPGFAFLGWATEPAAAVSEYAPGDSYRIDENVMLYAVWQELNPGEIVVSGGTCGQTLYWVYYESGLLEIYGIGAMENWGEYGVPWYHYRGTVTALVLSEGMTSIGDSAFYYCSNLTRVTIPASVTSIGKAAFHYCSSLTRIVYLGGHVSVWYNTFDNIGATVLYPIDNETWTARTLQTYTEHWPSMTCIGYRDVAEVYTIRYDANGGDHAPADQQKGHGVDLRLSDEILSREHYTFIGWATDPEATEAEYVPGAACSLNRDVTLYAVWEPDVYTVTFDANGGTGAPEPQKKLYDMTLTLSDTAPTRADEAAGSYTVTLDPRGGSVSSATLTAARTASYTFKHWNTAANGSGTSYHPGDSYTANEAVTLYAQWESSMTTAAVTLPTPTREGYDFKGWAASAAASSGMTGSYTPGGDVTLYAIWEQGSLEILSVTGRPGQEIQVPVSLSANPGLYTMNFHVVYDNSVLKFVGVEDGCLSNWIFSVNSGYVHWETPDDTDKTGSGVIVKLRFQILENAADGELALSIDDLEAFNREEKAISFGRIPGTVTVSSRIAGDVNGDGEISILDLVRFRKYLMHDTSDINASNADVTCDGLVNSQDLVRLRKYLAGDPYIVLD